MSQFPFRRLRKVAFRQDRLYLPAGAHRETEGEGRKFTTPCRELCELPAAFVLAPPAG
jgi:hypothetical protein